MTSSPLPSPLRLAISGKMASGKSTLAAAVAALLGPSCLRVSFAGKIRAIIRELHGVARTKDRDLLTGIGMLHRRFDPGTWLNAVRREVAAAPGRPCVLDDLRFENELAGLRADGWILVRLVVGDAERGRRLRAAYGGGAAEGHHGRFAAHPSETGLDATPDSAFDLVVVDRGGRERLPRLGPDSRDAHGGGRPGVATTVPRRERGGRGEREGGRGDDDLIRRRRWNRPRRSAPALAPCAPRHRPRHLLPRVRRA